MQHPVHVRLAVMDCPNIATTSLCMTRCTGWQPDRPPPPPVNPTYCQNWDIDLTTTTDFSYLQRSPSCIQRLHRCQLPAMIVQLHSNNSTNLSCPQRSSSCDLRLDRPQLPATFVQLHSSTQPTATHIKHLAVSPRLDLRQLPSSNIQLRTSTTRPY